jgi:hypothetical protein
MNETKIRFCAFDARMIHSAARAKEELLVHKAALRSRVFASLAQVRTDFPG